MAKRDYTRFKVNIPKSYKPEARRAIAREIIDHVIERTEKGKKDKNGNKFTPGYSKEYAKSRKGRIGGKRAGATPNLKLSGEMLNSLELVSDKPGELVIGYKKTPNTKEIRGKAEGNIRGSYGKKQGSRKLARDFMGIENKELSKIKKNYPLDDLDKLARQLAIIKEIDKRAEDSAGVVVFKTEDPDGEETI